MKRLFAIVLIAAAAGALRAQEPWREELCADWKRLPAPPITPYDGPFGGETRASVGKIDWRHPEKSVVANWRARNDWARAAPNGVYDPAGDSRPINLEVLPRVDDHGRLMVVAISHDKTEAIYDVVVDPDRVRNGFEAWDMLSERTIETNTDGRFRLDVPSWGVSVFMIGDAATLAPIKAALG